jgi:ABC-type transport system involved in cytochrome c biogenesis permease subunit
LRNPVPGWSSEALRNGWLSVHIVLILLGYAALLFTAVAATAYLIQERELKRKRAQSVHRILPPLGTLDELISKSLAAGFTFITAGIIVGSIWAFISYGSRWIGDTRITISFVTWAIYLALVFVRVGAGWRGRKTAILAIIALLCSAVTWVAHAHLGSRLV